MPQPTRITIHQPAYRRRALDLQTDAREAEAAYDGNIGEYMQYLKDEAAKAGYSIATDTRDDGPAYTIDESAHATKQAAHDWLQTLPDIWNWIP